MSFRSQAANWINQFDEQRPDLRVGIYGHYFPLSEKELLRKLRDRLRSDEANYRQTYLVEDLPETRDEFGRDNFLKSIFALENSNINLMVLTFNGTSQGVVRELDYVLRNPHLIFKSAVLVESERDVDGTVTRRAFTSLFEYDLAAVNFRVAEFSK